MATVRNSEVIFERCNLYGICTSLISSRNLLTHLQLQAITVMNVEQDSVLLLANYILLRLCASLLEYLSFRSCDSCRRLPEPKHHSFLFNPLKAELNPICYLLALLAHHFLHVSRIRVKSVTLRLLMSYVYGAPILDVSRSHTTTQHSR